MSFCIKPRSLKEIRDPKKLWRVSPPYHLWVQSQSNEPKTMLDDQKIVNLFNHIYVMPF